MKAAMLGLLAETPIHPGAGRSLGVVDLPVAREAATDYPVLVSTGLKGALRDKAEKPTLPGGGDRGFVRQHFGEEDKAGELMVSDGRILLLPVRSLTGAYRWVTCPHVLERYQRDLRRAGLEPEPPELHALPEGAALTMDGGDEKLFLEERVFERRALDGKALVGALKPLLKEHSPAAERLNRQIVVLNDTDFAWFARYALSINARNKLVDDTKQSESLWYEETLPPDTIMYCLAVSRNDDSPLATLFPDDDPYLQVGGNETVGQGWFAVTVREPREGAEA